MSSSVRQSIADSRSQYFSDFNQEEEADEAGDEDSPGGRKPSYVGLSHAVNGYNQYSSYTNRIKKISPPNQIPVSPPRTLDSVGLVLSQDSYQRSVNEFEQIMRDLSNGSFDMGRPQRNADVIDATANSTKKSHLISNGENFFPKTHSRQLISDGEKQSVEIVTKFHSDEDHSPTYRSSPSRTSPNGSKQNLVSKQIERLYGDTLCQVRMTSPESLRSPGSDDSNGHNDSNGGSPSLNGDSEKVGRKHSGGFFAKLNGICKMKDHSTRKVVEATHGSENSQVDFKPLKVPAVFKLLRPEFREQLKQSSCKIEIPQERVKQQERIIPIRREGDEKIEKSTNNDNKSSTPERVVPIKVSHNADSDGLLNNNNNINDKTPSSTERVIPIRRESGDISSTPKRPTGFAPKVNGFNTSPTKTPSNNIQQRNGSISNGKTPEPSVNGNVKQNIVRKLSPLSPKHIVVSHSAEKPTPMPKPEHLKSPPMSPEPTPITPPTKTSTSATTTSSTPSPTPSASIPDQTQKVDKQVDPESQPTQASHNSHNNTSEIISTNSSASTKPISTQDTTIVSTEVINNNNKSVSNCTESFEKYDANGRNDDGEYDNPEEYPEEFYYDNPPPCGLRERELLCPIMEEDNESTASGSIMNLSAGNGPVIGNNGLIEDPLLISEQGEVQDGHYFIKVLENEIFKFEENICDFEEDLNGGGDIPEEVRDSILTVIGMAKLLMAQKLTQFRELCFKNINVSREEDPFVPTCHDLAGFWDMVSIQVDQIHQRFQGLVDLRKAGWVVKKPEVVKNNKNNKSATKKTPVSKSKPKEKSEAAKARDEARKKMLEDRKRMMKEKAKAQTQGQDDMILIM